MNRKTIYKLTGQICQQLNEKKPTARGQIRRLITLCGGDFVEDILKQTLEIEANGGMLILDQSRRRTSGGVFLYLAQQQVSPEIRQEIFLRGKRQRRQKQLAQTSETQTPEQSQVQSPNPPAPLPPEIASKVEQLQLAAQALRQRVANLKGKPESQQQSLPMVERSLAKTEKLIQTLLQ